MANLSIESRDCSRIKALLPIAISSADEPVLTVFRTVSNQISHWQSDHQFWWWQTTAKALAIFLHQAGYDNQSQYTNLLFYAFFIIPELGPIPLTKPCSQWNSFMTDDGTPIELSWDWGWDTPVTVRYSIEPIGLLAGSASDPTNQYSGIRLVRQLEHLIPEHGLAWFNHFSTELLSFKNPPSNDLANHEVHKSRLFLAVDLYGQNVLLKAYFLPTFKAAELGLPNKDLIARAITRLPDFQLYGFTSYDILFKYLRTTTQSIELEILAIDCAVPSQSRIKIYLRSHSTDFDSVRDILTLGGILNNDTMEQGLTELKELWNITLGRQDPTVFQATLPHIEHRTAGILYNFELRPNNAPPVPKIYLPVRHYAQNDSSIVEGLQNYFKSHQQGYVYSNYARALELI